MFPAPAVFLYRDGFDLPKDALSYEEGADAIASYIMKRKTEMKS